MTIDDMLTKKQCFDGLDQWSSFAVDFVHFDEKKYNFLARYEFVLQVTV